MDKSDQYIEYINETILPNIDYDKLQESYATDDKSYAKGVLNLLHGAMEKIYGTDRFSCYGAEDFIIVPGVLQSNKTRQLCIALFELDLHSSGEHWGTDFLTEYGVISQSHEENKSIRQAVIEKYCPYTYRYTAAIGGDIHIDPATTPQGLKDFLNSFQNHTAELSPPLELGEDEADEDLEL